MKLTHVFVAIDVALHSPAVPQTLLERPYVLTPILGPVHAPAVPHAVRPVTHIRAAVTPRHHSVSGELAFIYVADQLCGAELFALSAREYRVDGENDILCAGANVHVIISTLYLASAVAVHWRTMRA